MVKQITSFWKYRTKAKRYFFDGLKGEPKPGTGIPKKIKEAFLKTIMHSIQDK
jgi:hypothetical protein